MKDEKAAEGAAPGARRLLRRLALAVGLIVLAVFAYVEIADYMTGRELVTASPDLIPSEPRLASFATEMGASAYGENCASCHGADLKGNQAKGIPNLTDDIWLYDFGRVSDIERTILYGIRSGNGKAHNVTDMPALGRQKAITTGDISDVIAYVRLLQGRKGGDPAVLERGETIFQDKGVCYDCHSRDGTGISDYGAPNLADDEWLYGGDDQTLYRSIYDGRHGVCPAWIGKLSFPTIRALAVFIHSKSKELPNVPKGDAALDVPRSRETG